MKLLVIGGLHGNEPLGLEVLERLSRLDDPRVTAVVGNPLATEHDVRYVDADLNRVFPGSATRDDYEERRAAELVETISDGGYDLVIDFHNTHTSGNDCGFVGDRGDRTWAAEAARFLRLPRVVIARYDCVNRYFPNCLSVEVSLDSPECRADLWVSRLLKLADVSPRDLDGLTIPPVFRFIGRVTQEQAEMTGARDWTAFRPIPAEDSERLDLPIGSHGMFVGDAYTPAMYSAVVVPSKLNAADERAERFQHTMSR